MLYNFNGNQEFEFKIKLRFNLELIFTDLKRLIQQVIILDLLHLAVWLTIKTRW